VYNFGDIQSRNPRVYAVNNSTFCGDTAKKSAYHVKYLRISWTYLELLYRCGRRIGGMIIPMFVWQSLKARCCGNQLNLEDGRRHRQERTLGLLPASAFDNRLANRKSAFKRLNGNIRATSYPNLVNFRPIVWEFTLLKHAIFATIRPQFDDDLHSSRHRSKTDWKIAILISAE